MAKLDFLLVFCAISLAIIIGFLIREATYEAPTFMCDVTHEYNITNEKSIVRQIHENRTYSNNYEKYMVYYPRTERECGRKAELRSNVYGISMQPFLFDGEDYYAEPITFKDVELGDVIVFNQGEGNTIHAVVGKYPDYLITAGYNNLYDDGRVYPDEIKYRWCFKK